MKRSKPVNSSSASRRLSRPSARSVRELAHLQRQVAGVIMTPLTPRGNMPAASRLVAETFIKPNDRLTSFERLQLYNRQYWYRLTDCFYEDYPGLQAVLGERKFAALTKAYLARYPSTSFTMRNLGQSLERFLVEEPKWIQPHRAMAFDMARLEWARVVAFDGEARPVVTPDDLLDSRPDRLRLALQPYLSLLELQYPLDDFLLAVKRLNTEALRGEASNAVTESHHRQRKQLRRPKAARVYVAVHRVNNSVYYKRLTRDQYAMLGALQRGLTLPKACALATDASAADLQKWFAAWASFGWFCRR
jgi:hypothetical protein